MLSLFGVLWSVALVGGEVEIRPPLDPVEAAQVSDRRELTADERSLVANFVRTDLIDPTSVLFKWATFDASGDPSEERYCGLYNARNRMGGYVGFKPFHAKVTFDGTRIVAVTDVFMPSAEMPSLAAIIPRMCETFGYDLDEVGRQQAVPG